MIMVIQTVDPFLMVIESSKVEFLLGVLDLNPTFFVTGCHHKAILSNRDCSDWKSVVLNLPYNLFSAGINKRDGPSMTEDHQVFLIGIGRDRIGN